ncbi:MAG: glycyl-radical enzyme activating protein [Deltaproteobacteria bacterium]|nr:glycyl-radical enzyme activating protein [Deltaproteobacteria bacterium]
MQPGREKDGAGAGPYATVLNIQRMSTEDGPGLRTTVFLKGCSLACRWCHNPEALVSKPQLVWHPWKCLNTRLCDAVCPEDALRRIEDKIEIDHARCTACGECADQCPSTALEILGRRWGLRELVGEVLKDRSYFETSEGGVTVSGGEPALRARFVAPFLERCRSLRIHTAIDTSGMCSARSLDSVARHADLILYDLKDIDSGRHARHTGVSNERILSNLISLSRGIREGGLPGRLWIRTPLIPGATFSDENLAGLGAFIARHLGDVVTRWELCAFNNLAADKYARLGMTWDFEGTRLMSEEELRHSEEIARRSGVDPEIILATGRTRLEPKGDGGRDMES